MQPNTSSEEKPSSQPAAPLGGKAKEAYDRWDNWATLNADDPFLVGVAKIGIRVVGILVLIALSPLILLGFLMAFIVVA